MEIFLGIVLSGAIIIWNTAVQYPLSYIKNQTRATLISMFVFCVPVVPLLGAPDDSFLHYVAFLAIGSGMVAAWQMGQKWQVRRNIDNIIKVKREAPLQSPRHENIP